MGHATTPAADGNATRPAIPAATLILFRETRSGPAEHLMIERTAGMAFAAGALVFPGGRIDADDHDVARRDDLCSGGPTDLADRAARVAAIRETVEETGIAVGFHVTDLGAWQPALKAGTLFGTLLERDRVTLDLDALVPFARWCPNLGEHRRFDTRFFIARAPADIVISTDVDEVQSHRWITARGALDAAAAGAAHIIFPTLRNLERLAAWARYDATVAHARATPPRIISPEIRDEDDDRWLCIPTDAGYPVTRARLADVMAP